MIRTISIGQKSAADRKRRHLADLLPPDRVLHEVPLLRDQHFTEVRLADAIVKQTESQTGLIASS